MPIHYINKYVSPLGLITMASDGDSLTGLWFEGQTHYASTLSADVMERSLPVFVETSKWLDIYFSGRNPDFVPPLCLIGSSFRMSVWRLLPEIPYGQVTTYKAIADRLCLQTGKARMSTRAVGGAIGHNPISIIVPCHRVIGSNGNLTGYAGGINLKEELLRMEHLNTHFCSFHGRHNT